MLTELVVAAALTIVVGALTMTAIVGPVGRLHEVMFQDERRMELETAADVIARVLRAARPGAGGPPIRLLGTDHLAVTVGGTDEPAEVLISVSGASLVLTRRGTSVVGPLVPEGVLLGSIEPDGLRIVPVDDQGRTVGDWSAHEVAAAVLTLVTAHARTTRVVRFRDQQGHAVVHGW